MAKATVTKLKTNRADRWVNETNGFGGSTDPITRTYFDANFRLTLADLENLFTFNSLAKRIITIPADDATREWIKITHEDDPDKAEFIEDEFRRLKVQQAVWEAITLSRAYGGSLMILGAFDGKEVKKPLGTVRKMQFLNNIGRFLAFPQTWYDDPDDISYGAPETYLLQRMEVMGSVSSVVHESRTIRFDGEYMLPLMRMRNFGWHAPVMQHVYEELRQYGTGNQATSAVLQDFITKKLKISNLQDLLSSEDGVAQITERLQTMAAEMAIHNIAIYGADEEMDKMGTPITGLPDLNDQNKDRVSGACGIPVSRLFQSESGSLGGDQGKNDLRVHYDKISSYQENELRPKIQHIIDLVGAQKGYEPGEVTFEFNPLWQMSEAEQADIYFKTSEGDVNYINAGVVEPEEVALSRFGGDGIDTSDMNIDVERREKYLTELSKQPIDLDEPTDNETPPPGSPDTGGDPGKGQPDEVEEGMTKKGNMEADK